MRKLIVVCLMMFCWVKSAQAIQPQQQTYWCWAASAQEILSQRGIYKSQSEIAATLDGWPRNRPAHIQELVAIFNVHGLTAWRAGAAATPQQLANTLLQGFDIVAFVQPLNGPVGHFVVLQGYDPFSGVVLLSDPLDGSSRFYTLAQLYLLWKWSDAIVIG